MALWGGFTPPEFLAGLSPPDPPHGSFVARFVIHFCFTPISDQVVGEQIWVHGRAPNAFVSANCAYVCFAPMFEEVVGDQVWADSRALNAFVVANCAELRRASNGYGSFDLF